MIRPFVYPGWTISDYRPNDSKLVSRIPLERINQWVHEMVSDIIENPTDDPNDIRYTTSGDSMVLVTRLENSIDIYYMKIMDDYMIHNYKD